MNGAMHKLLFERETQYEAMACRASENWISWMRDH